VQRTRRVSTISAMDRVPLIKQHAVSPHPDPLPRGEGTVDHSFCCSGRSSGRHRGSVVLKGSGDFSLSPRRGLGKTWTLALGTVLAFPPEVRSSLKGRMVLSHHYFMPPTLLEVVDLFRSPSAAGGDWTAESPFTSSPFSR